MSYTYVSKKLISNERGSSNIIIIIPNIKTKDIEEYVNNFLNTIETSTNYNSALNKTRIITEIKKQLYSIILTIRKRGTTEEEQNNTINAIRNAAKLFNVSMCSLQSYLKTPVSVDNDKLLDLINKSNEINLEFINIDTDVKIHSKLEFIIENNIIKNLNLRFREEVFDKSKSKVRGYTGNMEKYNNNVRDIIADISSKPYQKCRLHPSKLVLKGKTHALVYDIWITPESIDIVLVNTI